MLSEQLQELIGGVRFEQERLEAQRLALMDQVAAVDEELRVLRNITKAVDGPQPGPKPSSKGPRMGNSNTTLSEHTLRKVHDWMEVHPERSPFTAKSLAQALGLSSSTTSVALKELRHRGELVLAGQGESNTHLYRLAEEGEAPDPAPDPATPRGSYGITRAPVPLDQMKSQQREAELRKVQLVEWVMQYGKPFVIQVMLDEMGYGQDVEKNVQAKYGKDVRELVERGVLQPTGRNRWPHWKMTVPQLERGKVSTEYELAAEVPPQRQQSMNGAGHGEPTLAA